MRFTLALIASVCLSTGCTPSTGGIEQTTTADYCKSPNGQELTDLRCSEKFMRDQNQTAAREKTEGDRLKEGLEKGLKN